MHPAFDIAQRPHHKCPSILSQWLDLEASFPTSPFEFFVPDNPEISDDALEVQLKETLHGFIAASIHVRQARFAYGHCLAKLARRKAAKKRRINIQSAIFRLPTEILSYIFRYTGKPILSTHICHQWRAIALDTPSLWCHFRDGIGRGETKMFLKRAKNHPLIVCSPRFCRDMPLCRVKKLDLKLGSAANIKTIRNEPAPLLESLYIDCPEECTTYRETLFSVSLFTNYAPRLASVKFNGLVLPNFPTQSVTKLTLVSCFLPEAATTMRFLQSTSSLQSLVFWRNKFRYPPPEPLDWHLSSVKRLSYTGHTNISIITPNLEDLYLVAESEAFPVVYPGSSLRRLWLIAEHFAEHRARLIDTLIRLQGVQDLEITSWSVTAMESILSFLFRDLNALLPSLCRLFIDRVATESPDLAELLGIVKKRNVTVFLLRA